MSTKKNTIGPNIKGKIIECRLFPADIAIAIGDLDHLLEWAKKIGFSPRAFEILEKSLKEDKMPEGAVGKLFTLYGGGSLIWMKSFKWNVFIHEIMHATSYLLQCKGIRLLANLDDDDDIGSEETYAYVLEYLFKELRPTYTRRICTDD